MEFFGTYLKQERERQNISLDEVCNATKISRNIINAIEEDRQDLLPPIAFLKGFVRSYSLYLGLDPVETTAQYIQSMPKTEKNFSNDDNVSVDFYVNKPLVLLLKNNKNKAFIFAYIILMTALITVSFLWIQTQRYDMKKSIKNNLLNAGVSDTTPIDINKEENTSDGDEKVASIGTSIIPVSEKSNSEASTQESADENIIIEKKELVIRAIKKTWIDVKIDDEENFDFILFAGGEKKLEATDSFNLLIGNASGVDITFEGSSLGPLGNPNQVVRIQLPPI